MVASSSENKWECLARDRCGALQPLKVKFAPVAVADLKRLSLTDHMMSHHFHITGIPHVLWNKMFYSVNNICNHIIITSYYHKGKNLHLVIEVSIYFTFVLGMPWALHFSQATEITEHSASLWFWKAIHGIFKAKRTLAHYKDWVYSWI